MVDDDLHPSPKCEKPYQVLLDASQNRVGVPTEIIAQDVRYEYTQTMTEVETIPKTYAEAVATLALWNGEAGADDLVTYAAEDVGDNVVRIIHVSEAFPDTGDVDVFRFGASAEFPFRSAVALARPDQWKKIQSGSDELRLPADWKIAAARQVWPPLDEHLHT